MYIRDPLRQGHRNPLEYSCLENLVDRRAWQATVHGVARVGHDLATKPTRPNFNIFFLQKLALDLFTIVPLLVATSLL